MTDKELRKTIRVLIANKKLPWKEGRKLFIDLYETAKVRLRYSNQTK